MARRDSFFPYLTSYTYIWMNSKAFLAELAIWEELALLLRMIVWACWLLGAFGEVLALGFGFLLFHPTRGTS